MEDRREQILSDQLYRYLLKIEHVAHGTDAIPAAIYSAMDKYAKEWEDKYREANQFICDLGALLGEKSLGYDDLKWSIEDFRDAIDEKKKEMCLELLEYMAKKNVTCSILFDEPKFYYNGVYLTKEQLFENFL